jgi:hypothetical protein
MLKKIIVGGGKILFVMMSVMSTPLKGAAAAHQEGDEAREWALFIKGPVIPVAKEKVMLPVSQGEIIGDFFLSLQESFDNNASLKMAFYAQQENPFITVGWTAPVVETSFSTRSLEPQYAHKLCTFCNEILANKRAFIFFRIGWGKKPEDPIDLIDAWEFYSGLILPKKSQQEKK